MNEGSTAETLLVIHQDVSLTCLEEIARRDNLRDCLVLSTHALFPTEQSSIRKVLEPVRFLHFGEILNDDEMSVCDDAACEFARPHAGHVNYASVQQAKARELKNELIAQRVCEQWKPGRIFAAPGLGIDAFAWKQTGAVILEDCEPDAIRTSLISRISARFASVFQRKRVTALEDEEARAVFLCGTSRLRLASGVRPEVTAVRNTESLPVTYRGKRQFPAATIHGYDQSFAGLSNLEIFVDGLHPSNYPRAYLDMFTDVPFVVRDMFDQQWFERHGKRTRKRYGFLDDGFMPEPRVDTVSNIFLMLNHAGDWTALVNRSDTDLLVMAFCDVAEHFPGTNFIIRLHPTMATPEHEGLHSADRLRGHVETQALSNLTCSDESLEKDIATADLIVTEYSNVVVDGYRAGKPGIIANLTRRRNFMQDYTDLGFPTVLSTAELAERIREVISSPDQIVRQQSAAAELYNDRLRRFLVG